MIVMDDDTCLMNIDKTGGTRYVVYVMIANKQNW